MQFLLSKILLPLLVLLTLSTISFAENSQTNLDEQLSLVDYLGQVRAKNLTIISSDADKISNDRLAKKAQLITAFRLYGFSDRSFAEQNPALQFFRYSKVYKQNNQIGISHNSRYGLESNVYYLFNSTNYKDFAFAGTQNSLVARNSQATPSIELNLSLWQNLFGASTIANETSIKSNYNALKMQAVALSLQEQLQAEQSYWQLFFCRKSLEIQKQALASANKILDYIDKKAKMNLAESSDILQAKAMVQSKKILVQQAENQLKQAELDFNQKRNLPNDQVPELLQSPSLTDLQNYDFQQNRVGDSPFLLAKKEQMQANIASAQLEIQNQKPMLNLYTSYTHNVAEGNRKQAWQNSFASNNSADSATVGLKFSMPINFMLTNEISDGAKQKIIAERSNYQKHKLQHEIDWQNLNFLGINLQQNLILALNLVNIQKNKLQNERSLLAKGRTSTYQILVFEQEYSNAELGLWQIVYQLQQNIINRKLYEYHSTIN